MASMARAAIPLLERGMKVCASGENRLHVSRGSVLSRCDGCVVAREAKRGFGVRQKVVL